MNKDNDIREKAFSLTQRIIDRTGPRLAGTEASKTAAEILGKEMETFADKTSVESFDIHQGAFLGWIKLLVICYAVALVFLWLNFPLIAFFIALISILILVLQFFFYLPIIDMFFPKRKAYNAVGYIEPENEVKSQVIISGHHDSAHVFNFFIHQPELYNLRVTGSIIFVIMLCLVSLLLFIFPLGLISLIAKIILSLGFMLTGQMWFFVSKKGTPGAGDNLIASAMALEIGRYLSTNKLKHTRIIIASFDAEEEGLRGARAFAKQHRKFLSQIPSILLNTDCAYELKEMFFLTSDINGTVKLDQSLADRLVEIAAAHGIQSLSKPIAFLTGGTDAGELAKVGVKATTLIGMPWSNQSRSSVYHTENDTLSHVETEVIDAAIRIFVDYIKEVDES